MLITVIVLGLLKPHRLETEQRLMVDSYVCLYILRLIECWENQHTIYDIFIICVVGDMFMVKLQFDLVL